MFQISWIVTMLPASTTSLIVARVFCGIAGGGCFHVVPMYIKEISQDNIRGTLTSIFALAQSTGILLMYALGGFLDYHSVLWVVVGLPILTFLIFFKAPESPSFLVKMGKTNVSLFHCIIIYFINSFNQSECIQSKIKVIITRKRYSIANLIVK